MCYCIWVSKWFLMEVEWEKVVRGIDERIYFWGDVWDYCCVNMYWDKDGFLIIVLVCSFLENVSFYGVYDMVGNAWEWIVDYWSLFYYWKSFGKDPIGFEVGVRWVMRGGSWLYDVFFFVIVHN